MKSSLRDLGLALSAGLITASAFPKFNLFFLAWIGVIPLLVLALEKTPGSAFLWGWVSGTAFYALLLYWIPDVPAHYGGFSPTFSFIVYAVLILFLGLYWALFSGSVSLIARAYPRLIFGLIPFFWISGEYLLTHLFTGFPWGLIGNSQAPNLHLIQIASVTGVWGISFVLLLFQSLFLASMKTGRKFPFFFAVTLVLGLHVAGYFSLRSPVLTDGEEIRAAAVQGNVSSDISWETLAWDEIQSLFDRHLDLSRQALAAGADLIVWPEFSVPLCFSCDFGLYKDFETRILEFIRNSDTSLLLGSSETEGSGDNTRYFNAALCIRPDLEISTYHKMHLVPFGEYTPYRRIFGFIDTMTQAIGEIQPGTDPALHHLGEFSFGSPICYEIIFPDLVRQFVKSGADWLVTITNDGWYGRSAAPYQHFNQAVLRAVENRRYLVRAATTGISGIIDPYGRILQRSNLETVDVLTGRILPIRTRSLYTRAGDVLPAAGLTLWGLFLILALITKRKHVKRRSTQTG